MLYSCVCCQMVLRNVAMVFGPTLMLPSGSEEYLTAMSHTFTIVELLCKHVSLSPVPL